MRRELENVSFRRVTCVALSLRHKLGALRPPGEQKQFNNNKKQHSFYLATEWRAQQLQNVSRIVQSESTHTVTGTTLTRRLTRRAELEGISNTHLKCKFWPLSRPTLHSTLRTVTELFVSVVLWFKNESNCCFSVKFTGWLSLLLIVYYRLFLTGLPLPKVRCRVCCSTCLMFLFVHTDKLEFFITELRLYFSFQSIA